MPNTDTYYFPHKELYVGRYLFLYADADYLAHMLGLDHIGKASRNELFLRLAQAPDYEHIDFTFYADKEQ